MKKVSIFFKDLIVAILKYQVIVTVPTYILDLFLGQTPYRKFTVLLLKKYNYPFWFDLAITLLAYTSIAILLPFIFVKFIEYIGNDVKNTKIISAIISFIITLLTFFILFLGTINGLSFIFALILSIIFGYFILPRKNILKP